MLLRLQIPESVYDRLKNGENIKDITNFNRDNKKQKVHHDEVTHQETTYTIETQTVERSGYIYDD